MKLKYAGLESLFEEDQAVTTDEMVRPKMLIASTNEEETVLDQGNIGEGTGDYRTRIVNHMYVKNHNLLLYKHSHLKCPTATSTNARSWHNAQQNWA
jgi:hypothetical protein